MEHLHQVFQQNDQLVHDLFHVFYVYGLCNHENSKENFSISKKKRICLLELLYMLNDTFDIESFFYMVALNDLLENKMNYLCLVKNLMLVIMMVKMLVLLKKRPNFFLNKKLNYFFFFYLLLLLVNHFWVLLVVVD
jgi:hypothetical protein